MHAGDGGRSPSRGVQTHPEQGPADPSCRQSGNCWVNMRDDGSNVRLSANPLCYRFNWNSGEWD